MESLSIGEKEEIPCWIYYPAKYLDGSYSEKCKFQKIVTNRWVRCVVFCTVLMLCSSPYYGWQQFQRILFSGDVYSWLCEGYQLGEMKKSSPRHLPLCDAQMQKINELYTIASASEFIVGALAGYLLDHLGPRLCGVTGMLAFLIGVLCFILTSRKFVLYQAGMLFFGASVNLMAYATFILGDLFPRFKTGALTLVVSAQIACCVTTIVFWTFLEKSIVSSFQNLLLVYVYMWIPCCLMFFFTLPCQRKPSLAEASGQPPQNAIQEDSRVEALAEMLEEKGVHAREGPPRGPCQESDLEACAKNSGESNSERGSRKQPRGKWVNFREIWGRFLTELSSWDVQLFTLYYLCQLLQFVYYPTTIQPMFGPEISSIAGYLMPSQIAWGIFFGYYVDKTGTLPLCIVVDVLSALTFILMLTQWLAGQYIAIMLQHIGSSFIYTSKYTFISESFGQENFGKLVGYIGLVGGLFTFLNIPISNSEQYVLWSWIFLVSCGFCGALLLILIQRQKRKNKMPTCSAKGS